MLYNIKCITVYKGQICPVIIGSRAVVGDDKKINDFIGCAITLENNNAVVRFTNKNHKCIEKHNLVL